MNESMLKIADVAEHLNVSVNTVRNYLSKKDWDSIPKPKVKIGKSWRWQCSDVNAFKNGHKSEYKIADKKKLSEDWADYF